MLSNQPVIQCIAIQADSTRCLNMFTRNGGELCYTHTQQIPDDTSDSDDGNGTVVTVSDTDEPENIEGMWRDFYRQRPEARNLSEPDESEPD